MLAKTKIRKEKSILLGVFVLMFCISLVLILFERIKISERLAYIEQERKNKQSQMVLGSEEVRDYAINEYHDIVVLALAQLNSTINRYAAKGVLSQKEINNSYELLLRARVPGIYKDFHFKIISIVQNFLKEEIDIKSVLSDRDYLYEEFIWLKDIRS